MRTAGLSLLALVVTLAAAGNLVAQPFDQTTISFSLADDNILKDPGETRKNSPDAYIGGQAANATDRLDGSVFGKTASRLALVKRLDTGALYPEGALRVRLAVDSSGKYGLQDDSSFLSLNWKPMEESLLKLTMYPVDADRLRLGNHYDISWGGTRVFPKNFTKGLVPGFKISWEMPGLKAFAGLKTALVRSPAENILDNPGGNTNQFVERTCYGFLGGVDAEAIGGVRVQLQGGYFNKGTSTRSDVLGKRIHAGGIGGGLSYHLGSEVGKRLDLRMYYEDPDNNPLSPGLPADLGLDVAVEYFRLIQTLEDPDLFASTINEHSNALALSAGLRLDRLRIHFNAIYRDLSYIVWNVPGLVPGQAIHDGADLAHGGAFAFLPEFMGGEIFMVLSSDYFFEFAGTMGLTPALSLGLLLPATYAPADSGAVGQGPFAEEHAQGLQTTVVRGSSSGAWDNLPAGEDELPVLLVKLDLRYNLSQHFSLIGEVSYANDPNYAQVLTDESGHARRVFDDPHILGLGVVSELAF